MCCTEKSSCCRFTSPRLLVLGSILNIIQDRLATFLWRALFYSESCVYILAYLDVGGAFPGPAPR